MLIVANSVMDGLGLGLRTIFLLHCTVRSCSEVNVSVYSLHSHMLTVYVGGTKLKTKERCSFSNDKRNKLNSKVRPIYCISLYNHNSFSPNKPVPFD